MGIYLGQLPPAEIARLKAELAETLIANFCYPRFFDYRTESLQMRPVDRKKRQEVWLYLSSVDFTAWNRIDLTTVDFQYQIERLFIQFVQRNRSFFGEQGRRRMSDIRMLISACATAVAQGLRNHLTGQKTNTPPFGSPRPAVSWASMSISGKAEPSWEQISGSTMLLQQQLQELRGEAKTAAINEPRPAPAPTTAGTVNGSSRHTVRSQSSAAVAEQRTNGDARSDSVVRQRQPAPVMPPAGARPPAPVSPAAAKADPSVSPAAAASVSPAAPPVSSPKMPQEQSAAFNGRRQSGALEQPADMRSPGPQGGRPAAGPPTDTRQAVAGGKTADALNLPVEAQAPTTLPVSPAPSASAAAPTKLTNGARTPVSSVSSFADTSPAVVVSSASSLHARSIPPAAPQGSGQQSHALAPGAAPGSRDVLSVGEDDVAIFEQMRHQLLIWLRIEAIKAGLDTSDQSPAQLLEMLRQQAHFDETRLQVVSTLLNLANQVIKTGLVSVVDYKQALMFHLMHTRN